MSVKLLKVSLGASLVALAGVSWYAFTKEDARGENRSDIASEVSVKTSDLWAKAKEGDTTAFAALKARAEAGDAESQLNLGYCYFAGEGVSQSYEEAVKWLRKAAEQGNAESQLYLGGCYYAGKGVSQSYEEAVKWYRKAAEQGNVTAQVALGFRYFAGEGVSQSYEEAVKWFRKAAEQGNAESQLYLGVRYYNGEGVSQSYEEAVKWYRKAAEQGNAESQLYLGNCYFGGEGVSQSYEEAVKWLRKAAEQGNVTAQGALGFRYYNGEGVSQSYEEAVKWFRKAAEQGNELALKFLSSCPCETAHLLNVAYEASCDEFAKSQQNKEKYLCRLGKVNTALQAWANLNNHLSNCSSCGSEYKSAQMQYLYQTKSQLDAMHTYLENAVSRGLNGDNDSEDALIKIFEALNGMTKPFRNLFSKE